MATGIAGLVLAFVSYRKSSKVKVLDLRVELRREINEIHAVAKALAEIMETAPRSKQNIMAALGKFKSGETEQWMRKYEEDHERYARIVGQLPQEDLQYRDKNEKQLEELLIETHRMKVELGQLLDRYDASLEADRARSKEIRDNANSRFKG